MSAKPVQNVLLVLMINQVMVSSGMVGVGSIGPFGAGERFGVL